MPEKTHAVIAETEGSLNPGTVQQFLTFVLSGEIYGIGILHIREIIEYANLTTVPLMPDFISGVINLRGNVVPVVNLTRRFELEPREVGKRTSIIIIDIKDGDADDDSIEVGIVVDIVNEVIELTDAEIAAPPSFGARIRPDFIQGMGKIDDKLMVLLNVNHVLSIKELSAVAEITADTTSQPVSNA
ncbi:MAG: purine-binding chemotaxis protein CheW [Gammaproteobacteria bacterium]|nr:purine-binding chemotaxis protein CheW [Gammaproteobacteria bacterium]